MEQNNYTWMRPAPLESTSYRHGNRFLRKCKNIRPGLPEISALAVLLVFMVLSVSTSAAG